MVLGVERINARVKQPNDRINFIKPLPGPSEKYAQDFLERIAAICNPIMRKNRLSVMSLEEYAYNTEFLGRNFNAGEVIQLVLKSRSGNWLPFRFVQMVMMHELAHCVQMNHSGAFWKVKNQYSDELRELWAKDYTGEGMWSRGRTLLSGQYVSPGLAADEILPEHLCGGTFKSSGKRKRAAKPRLSWKEQKERRIKKKFGVDGKTLGADDVVKSELEQGKKTKGKPRVAGSNRGRDLRAAAALARFDTNPKEEEIKDENDITTDSGSETEGEDNIKTEPGEAHDLDGSTLHDHKGRTMVKVCDDEEKDDTNVKKEMDELSQLQNVPEKEDDIDTEAEFAGSSPLTDSQNKDYRSKSNMMDFGTDAEATPPPKMRVKYGSGTDVVASGAELSDQSDYSKRKPPPAKRRLVPRAAARPEVVEASKEDLHQEQSIPMKPTGSVASPKQKTKDAVAQERTGEFFGAAEERSQDSKDFPLESANGRSRPDTPEVSFNPPLDIQARPPARSPSPNTIPENFPPVLVCPLCSTENDIDAATCLVCNNVLDETQVGGTWKCQRETCRESGFVNAEDYGLCGVCGQSRR